MKNTIEDLGNGTHKVSISFDVTEHGHNFGMPRNYNLAKVQKLIRSKEVQKAIKDGYAMTFYGHGARDKAQGYLANERNYKTGEEQEPIGKVTKLSIKDKIVSYEALLVETVGNKTKSVVKMIENGIGGFSFVWDVTKGIFYGSDFVLSPNFNGNRVVMDSICSDGSCQLDTAIHDAVVDAIGTHGDLYDDAKDLLIHQDNVSQALEFKSKIKAMQDTIAILEEKIDEQEITIDNCNITIKGQKEKIEALKKQNKKEVEDAVLDSIEPLNSKINILNEKAERLKVLSDAIETAGLKIENDEIVLDSASFGSLLSVGNRDQYSFDEAVLDSIRKPKKTRRDEPTVDMFEFKY